MNFDFSYSTAFTIEGEQHPFMQERLWQPLRLTSGDSVLTENFLRNRLLEHFTGTGLEFGVTLFGWDSRPVDGARTSLGVIFQRLVNLKTSAGDVVMSEGVNPRIQEIDFLIGIGAPVACLSCEQYRAIRPKISVVENHKLRREIFEQAFDGFFRFVYPTVPAGYLLAVGGPKEVASRCIMHCAGLLTGRRGLEFREVQRS